MYVCMYVCVCVCVCVQVGDVYMLSISGFSPGVGHMGAQDIHSPQAMVQHLFDGSWTTPEGRQHPGT
jgi:alpha 1,6-mannosyltransferase